MQIFILKDVHIYEGVQVNVCNAYM